MNSFEKRFKVLKASDWESFNKELNLWSDYPFRSDKSPEIKYIKVKFAGAMNKKTADIRHSTEDKKCGLSKRTIRIH